MVDSRKVYYVFDKQLRDATDNIANIKLRSALVHTLIKSYKLLSHCTVEPIVEASEEDLQSFHTTGYIDYLKKAQVSKDLEKVVEEEETADFNLEYDCPLFENIYSFVKIIAGATLTGSGVLCPKTVASTVMVSKEAEPKSYLKYKEKAKLKLNSSVYDLPCNLTLDEDVLEEVSSPAKKAPRLMVEEVVSHDGAQRVVLNWFGGWHHAQRDAAEGFCYVNDIVIGIQRLLKYYKRVLYVDLDVHHGNGVENAFAHTPHVVTLSLHKYGAGYYPGTGSVNDVGLGAGKFHTVNVPLKDGITDEPYVKLFKEIADKLNEVYEPHCLVVQCGADCLSGDPLGGFNLTLKGLGACVSHLTDWGLPTLLLGGGGYNIANAARCYAFLTSLVVRQDIPEDIPENDLFHLFGPSFELHITPSLRKDENSEEYLNEIKAKVLSNLDNIRVKENVDPCR